ncbi:MAG: inorganic diphosphatase [Sinobacteraceae bacterium]|nr:inorganic diphosphatase [Nevskiaceae bacterium]
MRFDAIAPREPDSDRVHVVIDTPAGSANKYKLDGDVFRVSRVLPAGLVFPHDFGSIPGTRASDGDPLDVVVLGLPPTFPGCLITVRLIGVLRARQIERGKSIRNDRLIGVGETPVNPSRVRGLRDLEPRTVDDIAHFFEAYNAAQGRDFKITGRGDSRAAQAALDQAIRACQQTHES